MKDIFISYRREEGKVGGGEDYARSLYYSLGDCGLGFRVCFDKEAFEVGKEFPREIEKYIKECPVYILIVTETTFQFRSEEDWVRREMELALEQKRLLGDEDYKIIVISTGKTVDGYFDKLPDDLAEYKYINRLALNSTNPIEVENVVGIIKKTITHINHKTMWYAAQRNLECSKLEGHRFHNLSINQRLLPEEDRNKTDYRFPIDVEGKEEDLSLIERVSLAKKSMYLIGRGGIGKTTSLISLMEHYYEGKEYSPESIVPIFIELSRAPSEKDSPCYDRKNARSEFIIREVCKILQNDETAEDVDNDSAKRMKRVLNEPYIESIREVFNVKKEHPEYLLLLDGLNEVNQSDRDVYQWIVREIRELLDYKNVRLILTSRHEEATIGGTDQSIEHIYLLGLSDKTIKNYLESRGKEFAVVSKSHSLLPCLRIPLFLLIYCDTKKTDNVLTAGAILQAFFHEKTTRVYSEFLRHEQIDKYGIDGEKLFLLNIFLPILGSHMEDNGIFYITKKEIRELSFNLFSRVGNAEFIGKTAKDAFPETPIVDAVKSFKEKGNRASDDLDLFGTVDKSPRDISDSIVDECIIPMLVNSLCILYRRGDKYGFVHHHLRDYFAAVYNINCMKLASAATNLLDEEVALQIIKEKIGCRFDSASRSTFIGEILKEDSAPVCEDNLLRSTLGILRHQFKERSIQYAVRNILNPMILVRRDLSNENLSYLDLTYVAANGVPLGYHGSKKASLTGSLFGDQFLYDPGHKRKISDIQVSKDGNYLSSKDKSGSLILWDIFTQHVIDQDEAMNSCSWDDELVKQVSYNIASNTISVELNNEKRYTFPTKTPVPDSVLTYSEFKNGPLGVLGQRIINSALILDKSMLKVDQSGTVIICDVRANPDRNEWNVLKDVHGLLSDLEHGLLQCSRFAAEAWEVFRYDIGGVSFDHDCRDIDKLLFALNLQAYRMFCCYPYSASERKQVKKQIISSLVKNGVAMSEHKELFDNAEPGDYYNNHPSWSPRHSKRFAYRTGDGYSPIVAFQTEYLEVMVRVIVDAYRDCLYDFPRLSYSVSKPFSTIEIGLVSSRHGEKVTWYEVDLLSNKLIYDSKPAVVTTGGDVIRRKEDGSIEFADSTTGNRCLIPNDCTASKDLNRIIDRATDVFDYDHYNDNDECVIGVKQDDIVSISKHGGLYIYLQNGWLRINTNTKEFLSVSSAVFLEFIGCKDKMLSDYIGRVEKNRDYLFGYSFENNPVRLHFHLLGEDYLAILGRNLDSLTVVDKEGTLVFDRIQFQSEIIGVTAIPYGLDNPKTKALAVLDKEIHILDIATKREVSHFGLMNSKITSITVFDNECYFVQNGHLRCFPLSDPSKVEYIDPVLHFNQITKCNDNGLMYCLVDGYAFGLFDCVSKDFKPLITNIVSGYGFVLNPDDSCVLVLSENNSRIALQEYSLADGANINHHYINRRKTHHSKFEYIENHLVRCYFSEKFIGDYDLETGRYIERYNIKKPVKNGIDLWSSESHKLLLPVLGNISEDYLNSSGVTALYEDEHISLRTLRTGTIDGITDGRIWFEPGAIIDGIDLTNLHPETKISNKNMILDYEGD